MKHRDYFLVAVHAFFIIDEKVLLSERANTGYMDGFFSVPAGHVEKGESIWSAMKREIQEEVGVTIDHEHEPIHVMRRAKSDEDRIDYFFVIKKWSGELQNTEPEKCSGIEWYELKNLPDNTIPYIRFALEQIEKERMFSEFEETN